MMEPTSFFRNRAVGRAIRVAIVLPPLLGALTWAGYPLAGFLASFAVITILVIADFSGPRTERFASASVVTVSGAATLMLGVALQPYIWLQVVAALFLGIAITLIAVTRGFLSKATVPLLLPFFIAATESGQSAWQMLAGWCLGGVVAGLASVLMWPFFPRRVLTEALADALTAEADAVASFWGVGPKDPEDARDAVDSAVKQMHQLFLGKLSRPGSAFRRERSLVMLVEETRRMRLGLRLAFRRLPFTASKPDADLAIVTANALAASADVLREQEAELGPFESIQAGRRVHLSATVAAVRERLSNGDASSAQEIGSSSFRPRVISLLAMSMARDAAAGHIKGPLPPLTVMGEPLPAVVQATRPSRQVLAELSWRAPWMKNALRLGLALALALLVVNIMGLERGYWVVLGTLSVMRLDLVGTRRAATQVVVGQLVGFTLGVGLIHLTLGHTWLPWLLLPFITAALGYLAGNGPTWLQQAVFTLLVIALVSLSAPAADIAIVRFEDVAIGAAVAVVVSLLIYPRGLVPRVESALRAAVEASSEFFRQTVAVRGLGDRPDSAPATTALTRAAETIELALVQGAPQGSTLSWWVRVWGSCEYLVYVAGVLHVISREAEPSLEAHRADAAVSAAGERAATRFEKGALSLIERCTTIPTEAADDSQLGVVTYSADVEHALDSIDHVVAGAAQRRDSDAAEWAVHAYWQLGWVGEVDLLAANTHSVLASAQRLQTGTLGPQESTGVPVA